MSDPVTGAVEVPDGTTWLPLKSRDPRKPGTLASTVVRVPS